MSTVLFSIILFVDVDGFIFYGTVFRVSVYAMISVTTVSGFTSNFSWFFLLRFVRIKEDYILFFIL